jgi:serine/threonine protein kinase
MPEVAQSAFSTKFWQPGSSEFPILLEHYQIHGIIGEGGMGTVFKGYHLNLKRFVAIKTLRMDQRKSSEVVSRFKQEMQLVGQMDHPNVVRATDAGERNGIFYLVMEYLSGSDLSRLVAKRGRLDVPFACELARQAALGLDYIHQKTLIHRDIKPSNLMLTTTGLVKILDLGLARLGLSEPDKQERTPVGYAVGTYSYMAPEQATTERHVDGRADIYGLGCTLFKLLTGRAPFSGPEYDNSAKVLFAHSNVPLSTVAELQSIPAKLRKVLLKMTAKDPALRYRTGQEVAEALEPFSADSPAAQQTPLLERAKVEIEETPVRPLTHPLPAEFSQLTTSALETRHDPPLTPTSVGISKPKQSWAWVGWLFAAVVLASGSAALTWHFLLAPVLRPDGEPPVVGQSIFRELDELPAFMHHALLDRPTLPIGYDSDDPLKWRFDKNLQTLDVKGADDLLFPMGKTSRSRFSIETGIAQAPWKGNIGIFWGYRENADVKKNKTPDTEFAWLQLIITEYHEDNVKGSYLMFLRGNGALFFNALGELKMNTRRKAKYDIMLPNPREKMFQIAVQDNQLIHARFDGIELKDLCSPATNKLFESEPYGGATGLLTQGFSGTFSNARFFANSMK